MFQTIVDKNNGNIFHGFITNRQGNYFIFAFRVNAKNYIWECDTNYWRIVE
jgi:hypothetical protein